MSGKLTRFRIEGLHNIRTIDVPIIDNRLVLVGENGTGKNTVVNFIYFFLTTQWSRMLEHKFKSITAIIDSEEFHFNRAEIESLVRRARILRNSFHLPRTLQRRIESTLEEYTATEAIQRIEELANELKIPPRLLKQLTEDLQLLAVDIDQIKKLKSSVSGQILYLPTYRRIEQDLKRIFPDLDVDELKKPKQPFSITGGRAGYIELVEFGMDDVKRTIIKKTTEIKEKVRKDLSNLTGSYLRDVIQGVYISVESTELKDLDESRINDIFG